MTPTKTFDGSIVAFVINPAPFPFSLSSPAGKATTDEELEEMLEGGNASVFTAGVRVCVCARICIFLNVP